MEGDKSIGGATGASKKLRFQAFYRRIKALSPMPFLVKARDLYVRSMTGCAGKVSYGTMSGAAPGMSVSMARSSFGRISERKDDDFRELVRAASQRNTFSGSNSAEGLMSMNKPPFPRSVSASVTQGVGRIDEDSPCYFPASFQRNVKDPDLNIPRRTRSFNSPNVPLLQTRAPVCKQEN